MNLFGFEVLDGQGKFIPGVRCPHCTNTGHVDLDKWNPYTLKRASCLAGPLKERCHGKDHTCELDSWTVYEQAAAPCPNCNLGMVKNHMTAPDHPERQFWRRVSVNSVTWNGGLTARHQWCHRCDGLQDRGHKCGEPA